MTKETLLLVAAGLVVLVFVFQLARGYILSRRRWRGGGVDPELSKYVERATGAAEARQVLRDIDARAVEKDASVRSGYYSTGGEIALTVLKRPAVAVRYYLRALRTSPTCWTAFDRLAEILIAQKKHRRFERVCWDLLSRLDDDEVGGTMWKKCWSGLITVYAGSPRLTSRVDAIRKMMDAFDSEDSDGFESDEDAENSHCSIPPRIDSVKP